MIRSIDCAQASQAADRIEALDLDEHPAVLVAVAETHDVIVRALRHYAADLNPFDIPPRFDFQIAVCCHGETGNGPEGRRRFTATLIDMIDPSRPKLRSGCCDSIREAVAGAMAAAEIPSFYVEDYYAIASRGCYCGYVTNPADSMDFSEWHGRKVRLFPAPGGRNEEIEVEVVAVERHLTVPPIKAGKPIGFLFKWPMPGETKR